MTLKEVHIRGTKAPRITAHVVQSARIVREINDLEKQCPFLRYSNAARGKRGQPSPPVPLKAEVDSPRQPDSPTEYYARQRRRNWARLLKKIYAVDPLTCPCCGSPMEIIAFIEDGAVIRKILQHLGLWERPQRSPPPTLLPHKLETLLATLSPRQAQQLKASTDSVFWDDVPVFHG